MTIEELVEECLEETRRTRRELEALVQQFTQRLERRP